MKQILILFIVTAVFSQAKFNCNYLEENGKIVYLELSYKEDFVEFENYFINNKSNFNLKTLIINNVNNDFSKKTFYKYAILDLIESQNKFLKVLKINGFEADLGINQLKVVLDLLKESTLEVFHWTYMSKLEISNMDTFITENLSFFKKLRDLSFEGVNFKPPMNIFRNFDLSKNAFFLPKLNCDSLRVLNLKNCDLVEEQLFELVNNSNKFRRVETSILDLSIKHISIAYTFSNLKTLSLYYHNRLVDIKELTEVLKNSAKSINKLENFFIDDSDDADLQTHFEESKKNKLKFTNSTLLDNLVSPYKTSNLFTGYFSQDSKSNLKRFIAYKFFISSADYKNKKLQENLIFLSNSMGTNEIIETCYQIMPKRIDIVNKDLTDKQKRDLIEQFPLSQFIFLKSIFKSTDSDFGKEYINFYNYRNPAWDIPKFEPPKINIPRF